MNLIARIVERLFAPPGVYEDKWVHAYLSQSTDLHDLERRMRRLEQRPASGLIGRDA